MSPSQVCHKEKSDDNFRLYELVKDNNANFLGWEAIILFYSALHCVSHFFADLPKPEHPRSHIKISKLMARHLRQYAQDYSDSYYISRWARYEDLEITETWRDLCLRNYNAVKTLVP